MWRSVGRCLWSGDSMSPTHHCWFPDWRSHPGPNPSAPAGLIHPSPYVLGGFRPPHSVVLIGLSRAARIVPKKVAFNISASGSPTFINKGRVLKTACSTRRDVLDARKQRASELCGRGAGDRCETPKQDRPARAYAQKKLHARVY